MRPALTHSTQMIKLFHFLILILVLNQSCLGNTGCQQVELKVNIQNGLKGYLYVSTNELTTLRTDTFLLEQGEIKIKDCISGPKKYAFTIEAAGYSNLSFPLFMEAAIPLELKLNTKNDSLAYAFSGSKTQDEWNLYEESTGEIMHKTSNRDSMQLFEKKFIREYPDSYVSGVIIALNATSWSADTILQYLNMLSPKARTYAYAIYAKEILTRKSLNSVGSAMQSFTAIDWKGYGISSNQFTGKMLMFEFWASWCEPCRKSFPELQKIIRYYQPFGLEVLGISEDIRSEAWLKAIETDTLQNWHHILSGLKEDVESKGPEQRISYRFGVTVFPTRILINENGVIIGRWEGETEVNTTELKELLQKTFKVK